MNHRKLIGSLIATILALTCGVTAAGAKQSARPFKGSFTGSGYDFQGEYSHLGKFTGHITKLEATSPSTFSEEWTLTAANGDTVRGSGETTITGFDSSTGLYTFSGTRTFHGGTGRFADATGSYQAQGEVAGDLSTYYAQVNGTIGY